MAVRHIVISRVDEIKQRKILFRKENDTTLDAYRRDITIREKQSN
jgi:hypothetical protein